MDKIRVLLVDDEITILEGFKKLFDWSKYGCEVVGEAMDGTMAINQADALSPDLMIVDVNIPVISGLEVIKLLHEKYEGMQFIVVSGYDEFEYCLKALRLQVADYILKPVDFSEFGRVINRIKMNAFQEKQENQGQNVNVEEEGMLIFRMTSFLQDNLSENINLQSLSDKFHLNASYISQMFKNKTGMNYHNYLEHIRMMKAKKLLTTTEMSISEISFAVGYRDYRVFTKMYKSNQGILPSEYRKLNNVGR
jgi:two-component system, response regulator YesN